MSEEEKELISSFESIVQGLEQYRNYDTIRGCIDCNDCSEKCYTIKEWEKIKNLIENNKKEIENSVSKDKIRETLDYLDTECSHNFDDEYWVTMGTIRNKFDELLEE